ncbi:MAG: class I SAM-dependent methyltransferase [Actinomycetota bacterium]|nr:class I SAM-dependent methyltransferase [Actinomycetota bacterium]
MLKAIVRGGLDRTRLVPVRWHRRPTSSWLSSFLKAPVTRVAPLEGERGVERRASATAALGPLPVWDGYPTSGDLAWSSDEVRTSPALGALYSRLVMARRPSVVVEFGTGFGVSGMYWLLGLEAVGRGTLHTFEPNAGWYPLACENLSSVSHRFVATHGTFEDHVDRVVGGKPIDIAMIDAIHTRDAVMAQYAMVVERLAAGGIVVLDDIDASDEMLACWRDLASAPEVRASARLGTRVGLLEL